MSRLISALLLVALFAGGAYYLGLVSSGPLQNATNSLSDPVEECHKTAIAARTAADPTSAVCDWKAVLDLSAGAALTGRYDAISPGINGRMIIVETADKPAVIALSTAGAGSDHTCTAALSGERSDDTLISRPAEAPGCEIKIRSSTTPDVVSVEAAPACSHFCGMRLGLSGDFKLAGD